MPFNAKTKPKMYRLLEIIPGGLVWLTFVLAVVLSFLAPQSVMYFVIIFDLFWMLRVVYFVIFVLASWVEHRRVLKINWLVEVGQNPEFENIYHLIFLPTFKENIEILRTTFLSLINSQYNAREKFIVVLAGEEGDRENFLNISQQISKEFGAKFKRLLITVHPKDVPGELRGKGSNIHYAGKEAQKYIDDLGLSYENVIVSSFDIDTCVHPQYFAYLTDVYLKHPNRTHSSYQPIALYNNNMWDAPALVRVAAFGTTFWLMTELARQERLSTFSSHSMPFKALVEVGFWQNDIVTEDSRIFLQCLLHYNGEYEVTPLYLPVSMDTVMSDKYAQSLANLYKQQRRWAWGVEHIPFLLSQFWGNKQFPFRKKAYYLATSFEGMYTWATAPLLIFVLGYLPLWLAPEALKNITFYQNTPHTLELLMRLSLIGLFACAIVATTLLPPRPDHKSKSMWFLMIIQWVLTPITFVIFGAFPAIDAQTHLMLGRYLGFNVTEKKRK